MEELEYYVEDIDHAVDMAKILGPRCDARNVGAGQCLGIVSSRRGILLASKCIVAAQAAHIYSRC